MAPALQRCAEDIAPSEVRRRILEEHRQIRQRLQEIEAIARQVLAGDASRVSLGYRVGRLYDLLIGHLALEDAILAPALRDTDSFGPVRAEQLLAHHAEQRVVFAAILKLVSEADGDGHTLARTVLELSASLHADMDHEDRDILSSDLLRDDPLNVDIFTG